MLKELVECFENNKKNILIAGHSEHYATYGPYYSVIDEKQSDHGIGQNTGSNIH
jgi:hypothetical protein